MYVNAFVVSYIHTFVYCNYTPYIHTFIFNNLYSRAAQLTIIIFIIVIIILAQSRTIYGCCGNYLVRTYLMTTIVWPHFHTHATQTHLHFYRYIHIRIVCVKLNQIRANSTQINKYNFGQHHIVIMHHHHHSHLLLA